MNSPKHLADYEATFRDVIDRVVAKVYFKAPDGAPDGVQALNIAFAEFAQLELDADQVAFVQIKLLG